jgi:hypothetical protein
VAVYRDLGRYLPLGPCLSFCVEGNASHNRHQGTGKPHKDPGALYFLGP